MGHYETAKRTFFCASLTSNPSICHRSSMVAGFVLCLQAGNISLLMDSFMLCQPHRNQFFKEELQILRVYQKDVKIII